MQLPGEAIPFASLVSESSQPLRGNRARPRDDAGLGKLPNS